MRSISTKSYRDLLAAQILRVRALTVHGRELRPPKRLHGRKPVHTCRTIISFDHAWDTKERFVQARISNISNYRVNVNIIGKQWHAQKSAFRPKAGQTSFEKRTQERKALAATKAKEKEMKDEKEEERQVEAYELGIRTLC